MKESQLLDLYNVASKHSNYQVLPAALEKILPSNQIAVNSRHEDARLAFICAKVNVAGLRVADVGGNTGFFSFELLDRGARQVDYYEGNKAHHDFVHAAAAQLELGNRLKTFNRYVTFTEDELAGVDCTLLLNVLHHLGDDFGDAGVNKDAAKTNILACLSALSHQTRQLVFQLGFNWKGDRHQPLFAHGTKAELIEFVRAGTQEDWTIDDIGIAEQTSPGIEFRELNHKNVERVDALGEFLNRPIFILRSKRC